MPFLENTCPHASVLTILVISVERYYAICHPLRAKYTCTIGIAIKALVIVWVVAIVVSIPFLFIAALNNVLFFDGSHVDVCNSAINSLWKNTYVMFLIALFFIFPVVTLVVLYSVIVRRLVVDATELYARHDSRALRQHKSRRQVVYMIVAVILLFFICLLPIRAVTLWYIHTTKEQKHNLGLEGYLNLMSFSRLMFYLNSAINPLLYNLLSTKFRHAFSKTLGCKAKIERQCSTSVRSNATHYTSLRSSSVALPLETYALRTVSLTENMSLSISDTDKYG